jgi:CRISPR-associated exonuclease Cas4
MDGEDEGEFLEVPISALAHWAYCARRCALIHVEQTFDENVFTVRGRVAHHRADTAPPSTLRGVRVVRGLPLFSAHYGLVGKADVVELHPGGQPVPVEYKLGRRPGRDAEIQLCAQALCLEEAFGRTVSEGAIYSHTTHRRRKVSFEDSLRADTIAAIQAVRELLRSQELPTAPNDKRCPNCSLFNACLPDVVGETARLRGYQGSLFLPLPISEWEKWADV